MTRRTYSVTAELLDPIALRRARQSQRSDGLTSIAGGTLRGALARNYLDSFGKVDATFRRLFLDDLSTRYGPLAAATKRLPLTASSCKRHPGSPPDGHGIVDQLWLRAGERLRGDIPPLKDLDPWMWCGQCQAALKPASGCYDSASDRPQMVAAPETTVEMHVGIDRGTSTAATSILYALQAIDTGHHALHGTIEACDESIRDLCRLLDENDRIRVGHAKTRGYGRVRLSLTEPPSPSSDQASAEQKRREAWSHDCARFLSNSPFDVLDIDPDHDLFFSISFPQGAILVDRWLRFSTDVAEAITWLPPLPKPMAMPIWTPAANAQNESLQAVTGVIRHEIVRGWHAARGLPKSDQMAVSPGSVYFYRWRGCRDTIHHRLDTLVDHGIGLQKVEGFGQVMISDPFHRLMHLPHQRSVSND